MKTLKQLIESKKFTWVDSDINEDIFPVTALRSKDYKLFYFGKNISSGEVIEEMFLQGYTPATIHELLAWNGWNGMDWVISLGSVGRVDGFRYVPYLLRGDSERVLGLLRFDFDWFSDFRFLAVHSDLNSSEPLKSGTLDNLPLELVINGVKYVKSNEK